MFFCLETFSETYALTSALMRIPCMYILACMSVLFCRCWTWQIRGFPCHPSLQPNSKITVKMWCSLVSLRNAFQFWIIGKNPAPQIFSGLGLFRASVAAQQCLLKRQVSFLFCSSVLRLLAHYFRVQGDRCYSPQTLFLGRRNSHHTSYMYPLFFLWFYRMLSLIFDKLITNPWSQFNHELTELDHRFFRFSEEVAHIMGKQMWFS